MRARRSIRKEGSQEGEQGFWPSYADMMSAVALILFFLMLLSYIQNLITGNDLQNTQELLAATKSEVEEAQARLATVSADLELVGSQLEEAQTKLDLQQQEIAGYSVKIEEQTEQIASQEKLISDQKEYLLAANDELTEMRDQMQAIAVLRLSILEQIRDSLEDVMGSDSVSIGDNGNIILSEGILFDSGSSEIKEGSETALNKLITVLYQFLKDPDNAQYVDSIVISGHTDSTGTDDYNRELSTDRANSVLSYLLSGKNGILNKYASYFCAAGYGATRPVASNSTEAGRAQNRRIEISIILKDDTVLEIVDDYLKLDVPDVSGSNAD